MTTTPTTIDTNASQLSYGVETTWGTNPAGAFKAIRYTGETLSMDKTRTRPTEINNAREVIQAVTTSLTAGGAINYALSYGTYDDFMASAVNSSWGSLISIAGAAGDIAISTGTISCTLTAGAGKWTGITAGNWIRTLGFVTNGGQNNQIMYVVSVTSTVLTCNTTSATVAETPTGTLAQVRQKNMRNGSSFTSLTIQQKYSSALWLRYAGAFVTGMTITGGIGNYLSGSITLLASSEASATTDASSGVTAAPTGSVMNPIGGFGGVFFNEVSVGIVDSFAINISSPGAALEYGMGSATAQGLMQGNLEVTGTIKIYFQNFTLYSNFIAETQGRLSVVCKDTAGQAYVFQVMNSFLSNPTIDAGGPNQAVFASFTIEGNPVAASSGTISLDALPAT